jgi:hypothetical protein
MIELIDGLKDSDFDKVYNSDEFICLRELE